MKASVFPPYGESHSNHTIKRIFSYTNLQKTIVPFNGILLQPKNKHCFLKVQTVEPKQLVSYCFSRHFFS